MTGRMLEHDWFDRPLPANVEIGEGSWLHSSYTMLHHRSTRERSIRIGHHTGVYVNTFFDTGPDAEIVIGDWTTVVSAIFATNHRVSIGDYVFIAHEVFIADSQFAVPGGGHGEGRDVVIHDGAWIGVRAVLLGGAVIGEGAVVGAGAVVDFEVPPGRTVAGNPARVAPAPQSPMSA
jgi:acetyltransferase-like isoleucine patch superfamily enzyme